MPTHKPLGVPAIVTLLFIAWGATADAQIWFPYPPYRYRVDRDSSVRLEVTPKEAEVYVDGYYAGVVDDFDGVFQRLHVVPGEHEITIYREGYRTVSQKVYLTPASTFKIKYKMERLAAGDVAEPRPVPVAPPAAPQAGPAPPPPPRGPIGRRGPPPPNTAPPGAPPLPVPSASAALAIRVQPADAEVLIDGEIWHGPTTQDRLVVELPEGPHNVEIRKPGFVSYLTDVQLRRGETTTLNVSLRTQP